MTLPFEAAVSRQRNRNKVYAAVIRKLEQAAAEKQLSRKDIADKIGRSAPHVSRWLKGPSNWTLDTISDLLWAIDAEMDYEVIFNADRAKQNRFNVNEVTLEGSKTKNYSAERWSQQASL